MYLLPMAFPGLSVSPSSLCPAALPHVGRHFPAVLDVYLTFDVVAACPGAWSPIKTNNPRGPPTLPRTNPVCLPPPLSSHPLLFLSYTLPPGSSSLALLPLCTSAPPPPPHFGFYPLSFLSSIGFLRVHWQHEHSCLTLLSHLLSSVGTQILLPLPFK